MPVGLLGKKIGMTNFFDKDGNMVGVTVIEAGPCYVVQNKVEEKDGYRAVQIGFGSVKEARLNKPRLGSLKKLGIKPLKHLHEFSLNKDETFELGSQLKVDIFNSSEFVDVIGKSKGKGFAGVVKRYGFKGGKATHGSTFHRTTGSIGATTSPGKVLKRTKMPGQMGNKRVTSSGLFIVQTDPENNLLIIKGSIPGAPGGLVVIQKSKKIKRVKVTKKAIEEKKGKKPSRKK